MPEERSDQVRVLVVDDDEGDVLMIRDALHSNGTDTAIDWVSDGAEAIDFLRQRGRHRNAVRPDLILLDLNMPRVDGREVLAEVKADMELGTIPIVVFTTSTVHSDIVASYQLHANAYIAKPMGLDDFIDTIQRVDTFFSRVVVLPPRT